MRNFSLSLLASKADYGFLEHVTVKRIPAVPTTLHSTQMTKVQVKDKLRTSKEEIHHADETSLDTYMFDVFDN